MFFYNVKKIMIANAVSFLYIDREADHIVGQDLMSQTVSVSSHILKQKYKILRRSEMQITNQYKPRKTKG